MKTKLRLIILFLLTLPGIAAHAQQEIEMADSMRSSGKIYVVVAIILVVLLGLVAYLFAIDRKVTRIEKRIGQTNR